MCCMCHLHENPVSKDDLYNELFPKQCSSALYLVSLLSHDTRSATFTDLNAFRHSLKDIKGLPVFS